MGHKKVAIIGGGLAGTACAYVLRQKGHEPVIFEKASSIADGASGNNIGAYNPRFYAEARGEAHFYRDAFLAAADLFPEIDGIDHLQNGTLHLMFEPDKIQRFRNVVENSVWEEGEIYYLNSKEASDVAGVHIPYDAVYLPRSGCLAPHKLCRHYAGNCRIEYNADIDAVHLQENGSWCVDNEIFDAVILACGAAVKSFSLTSWFPVYTVRGQIIDVQETVYSSGLTTNLCYGGYISAPQNGRHVIGSTFQRWIDHTEVLDEDSEYILNLFHERIPDMEKVNEVHGARASMRCSTPHRIPVIGAVPNVDDGGKENYPGLFVTTAHGSHGLVTTLQAAHMIVDQIEMDSPSYEYEFVFSPQQLWEWSNKVTD